MSSKFPIGVATTERPLIILFILYVFIYIISCAPVNLSNQDEKSTQENTISEKPNNIIEVQAFPESNDIIGLQDLYLKFNIEDSLINMVKDTISSGDQISGVGYKVTSSYTNGKLVRG